MSTPQMIGVFNAHKPTPTWSKRTIKKNNPRAKTPDTINPTHHQPGVRSDSTNPLILFITSAGESQLPP
jgi:hypothetical protein